MTELEWWPDDWVYHNLVDIYDSAQKALAEIEAAVPTCAIRSMRYRLFGDGVRWKQMKENDPEFWRGRRYLPSRNGLLWITAEDRKTVDSTWVVVLNVADASHRWPSLGDKDRREQIEVMRRKIEDAKRQYKEARQSDTAIWVANTVRQMKTKGQIPTDSKITHFAKAIEQRMPDAVRRGEIKRAVGWRYIKNSLPDWGLWPPEKIK